uniref:NADH-ubiquinone oxidoreductase chain 1 n=1 Tax=Endeis sp. JZ-2022 TaxID=2992007 RepID=A0A9E8AFV0_9CHEL|nr:NADH dehydrogenase subunit 1 [Endeis sp. JZ-2022]
MMDLLVNYLILLVFVMLGVAYFTLLERKILGYSHLRKGPNKVGMLGLGQPISDALKLLSKEYFLVYFSVNLLFFISPLMIFIFVMLVWLVLPMSSHFLDFEFGMLFFLVLTSLNVYSLIFCGWSSNSKYSIYGSYRGIAQVISYEVSIVLIFLSFGSLLSSFNFESFTFFQDNVWFFFVFIPLVFLWFVSMLAESNRTPFDFTEGESELISGFNIEYGSFMFTLIFLGEYASIIFMSGLFSLMFMGGTGYFFCLKMLFLIFIFVLVRCTLVRFRYDNLMYLAWKIFLPLSLNFLLFYFALGIFVYTFFL